MNRRLMAVLSVVAVAATLSGYLLLAQSQPRVCTPTPLDVTVDGTWAEGAAMPTARSELGAALLDGVVYVVGGLVADGVSSALEAYHVAADSWQTLPDLPVPVHHAGVAALDGTVYVVGGYNDLRFQPDDRFWAYDVEAREWRQLASLPERHAAHQLVAAGERLYLIGGVPEGTTTWAYDPALDRWDQELAPMPTPREHLGVTVLDGMIYVAGGRWNNNANTGAFERYDPEADTWTALADMPTPRGGFSIAAAGDRIYAGGGEGQDGGPCTFNRAEVYNPESGEWARLPDMPRPRHGIASVGAEGRWYIVGGALSAFGETLRTTTDSVDIFTPAGFEATDAP